jgi:hypothetical protein
LQGDSAEMPRRRTKASLERKILWSRKIEQNTLTEHIEDFPLESNESSERTALTEKGAEHELHLLLRAALNTGHQLTQAEHLLLRTQCLLNQIIGSIRHAKLDHDIT